jgi:hypothetical protein
MLLMRRTERSDREAAAGNGNGHDTGATDDGAVPF